MNQSIFALKEDPIWKSEIMNNTQTETVNGFQNYYFKQLNTSLGVF